MAQLQSRSLVGTWRRFGPVGPTYEVIALVGPTPDGTDQILRIRLAETGEEVDYTLSRAVEDQIVAEA